MKYFMMIKLPRIRLEPALEVSVMTVVELHSEAGKIMISFWISTNRHLD